MQINVISPNYWDKSWRLEDFEPIQGESSHEKMGCLISIRVTFWSPKVWPYPGGTMTGMGMGVAAAPMAMGTMGGMAGMPMGKELSIADL